MGKIKKRLPPSAALGAGLLAMLAAFALLWPLCSPFDTAVTDLSAAYLPPLAQGHLLGTDLAGRDVLTLLARGLRVSLAVALCAAFVQVLIGFALGLAAGLAGGWVDRVISAVTDLALCLPTLLILLVAGSLVGSLPVAGRGRTFLMAAVIGLLSWPACARLARGEALRGREQGYMRAAAAGGIAPLRLVTCHLLPNVLPQIAVTATLAVGDAILAESVLSFLGLGVSPPMVSLGAMLQPMARAQEFRARPWLWLGAAGLIFLCVLAFHLLSGEKDREAFLC